MLRWRLPPRDPTTVTSTTSLSSGFKGANIDSSDVVVEKTNMSWPVPPDTGSGLSLGSEESISRKVKACGRSTSSFLLPSASPMSKLPAEDDRPRLFSLEAMSLSSLPKWRLPLRFRAQAM